jgi:hypothetical protein
LGCGLANHVSGTGYSLVDDTRGEYSDMSRFYRFMKLYWTELVPPDPIKMIADPVRIEIFHGPRHYDVLVPVVPRVVPSGKQNTLLKPQRMELSEDRTYIELTARAEAVFGKRQFCEDHIDRVIAQLSAILSPQLFEMEVWRGWLSDGSQLFADSWLMMAEPVNVDPRDVEC